MLTSSSYRVEIKETYIIRLLAKSVFFTVLSISAQVVERLDVAATAGAGRC